MQIINAVGPHQVTRQKYWQGLSGQYEIHRRDHYADNSQNISEHSHEQFLHRAIRECNLCCAIEKHLIGIAVIDLKLRQSSNGGPYYGTECYAVPHQIIAGAGTTVQPRGRISFTCPPSSSFKRPRSSGMFGLDFERPVTMYSFEATADRETRRSRSIRLTPI